MGHKPNVPRKKRVKGPLRNPETNAVVQQHKTPEGRAKYRLMLLTRKKGGRPLGVPDGHTVKTIKPIVDKAKRDAKKAVSIMTKETPIEDPRAAEALETAVEIMRTPVHNRDRLQAAKIILDFTKIKPVAKSEVTIGNAEAFLTSLLDDEDGEQEDVSSES
jgi:hypothetical protein